VLFLIGAVAICGLPPLNGFVGEFLLYIGLFTTALETPATWGWVALAAPALAVVGAMAVASFIKLVCTVFVAAPRSPHAAGAHDPDWKMTLPMWVMAAGCLLIGVFPQVTFGALDRATASWAPQMPQTTAIANHLALGWLTALPLLLLATVTSAALWFWRGRTHRAQPHAGTWDCGYALPTPRMQYSGSSFSQMIVELLSWIVWPGRKPPRIDGVFPSRSNFASNVGDVVLDRALLPAFSATAWLLGWARIIQRGPIQVYLLYVLGILIMLLLFA
jgi:hydrogenase-4 component B